MRCRNTNIALNQGRQQGVSIIVALVMLLVLTLLGVSSMNSSIIELKTANSMLSMLLFIFNMFTETVVHGYLLTFSREQSIRKSNLAMIYPYHEPK